MLGEVIDNALLDTRQLRRRHGGPPEARQGVGEVERDASVALAERLYGALAAEGHARSGTQALVHAVAGLSGIDF